MEISIHGLAIGFSFSTFLWSTSFWYLLRFEKAFISIIDSSSSIVTGVVVVCAPFIATWFLINRWFGWSLE